MKLDTFVERFLVVACGNEEDVSNRLDINRLGDDDTLRSDMDDDSFLTYLDDDVTLRSYFDDATLYTDATTSTRYEDRGFEIQRPNEQVKRAIDTIKKYADRLGVSAEELLRSPVLLQRIREQQRNVSPDVERNWFDVLRTIACDQPTFQYPSVIRGLQDDLAYNGDSLLDLENDDSSYGSASISELTRDSGLMFAKQRTTRAGNSNRRFKVQNSTCNVLQTISETHPNGESGSTKDSYHDDNSRTFTKRRFIRKWL